MGQTTSFRFCSKPTCSAETLLKTREGLSNGGVVAHRRQKATCMSTASLEPQLSIVVFYCFLQCCCKRYLSSWSIQLSLKHSTVQNW